MQDSKKLKTEIISALDFLSADSLKLLAKFVAFLRANPPQEELEKVDLPQRTLRISSPRLAQPEQVADFKKEVVWVTPE